MVTSTFSTVGQDLRFSARQLRKSPAFFFIAVMTLAFGIGANVAVFSIVDAVLLRPFAFARPEQLVWIYSQFADNPRGPFTLPEFCDYRDQTTLFDGLGAVGTYNANLLDGDEPERVQGVRLSASIFEILGVHSFAGRILNAADDQTGAPPVVMISYGLWTRKYARENVIGRSVNLNGEARTIVGVLPPDFVLPNLDRDVVVPLQPDADPRRFVRTSVNFLRLVGRLKPGVTPEQAHGELESIRQNLRKQFPDASLGNTGVIALPLADEIVGRARPMLVTLLGAVAALLLIACANLASMSVARGMARHRELAVRSALGASRGELVRLLLAESALLAIAGGALGFAVAFWGSTALARFVPTELPRIQNLALDYRILFFTSGIILAATAICGFTPAWLLSRTELRDALAAGGRGSSGGPGQSRVRRCLVAGQIGLALVLLAGAGLFLRSFAQLSNESAGFDPRGVLTVRLSLPQAGYPGRNALVAYYEKLSPRLMAIPGVKNVGLVSLLPLTRAHASVNFSRADRPPANRDDMPVAHFRVVTPGYFETLRIRLLSGRNFSEEDTGDRPPVAIVSAPLARKFFPDRSPIGQRLLIDDNDTAPRPVEIVGVVAEVKQEKLEVAATSDIYLPLRQVQPESVPWLRNNSFWVLQTAVSPLALESAVRKEIRAVDPNIPASSVRSMEQVMDEALAARRFTLFLVGIFAATALFLAAAGLYAVIAHGVGQRTREIGLRLALGASHRRVLGMILSEGLRLVLIGIAVGGVAAIGLVRLISNQLYGVGARDPVNFGMVVVILAGISLVACWLGARRALRIDPAEALRTD